MDMPPGLETLVNYGALGVFMAFVLWSVVRASRAIWDWGFSRDKDNPGLITLKMQASAEKDRRLSVFVDSLDERDRVHIENCQKHHAGLVQLDADLVAHDNRATLSFRDVSQLSRAASQFVDFVRHISREPWPPSQDVVERHCKAMEETLRKT